MQRADVGASRMITTLARLTTDPDEYSALAHNEIPPSPTSSTGTPVFVATTPPNDSPPPSSMNDSWIAVTPNSDDEPPGPRRQLPDPIMTPDLALVVEGLRIHEHEESFPSEGEDEDDEDLSIPTSEDSSAEDDESEDLGESSDEETILAPRTRASSGHPISDEALRASLSTLLKSKDSTSALVGESSPRRATLQGPIGMESIAIVTPEELANRTSITTSRASSSKSHSRLGKKSHSKRSVRSPSKAHSKDKGAQVYAIWTAAITAGFLVGFGAGYAWKEYLAGGTGSEDVRRVGCTWCGDGKR